MSIFVAIFLVFGFDYGDGCVCVGSKSLFGRLGKTSICSTSGWSAANHVIKKQCLDSRISTKVQYVEISSTEDGMSVVISRKKLHVFG